MAKLEQPSSMPPTDRTRDDGISSNANSPSHIVELHPNIIQPLHPTSINQTPGINMPPSARQLTTQFNHNVMQYQPKSSSKSSTPGSFKNTPITVQMTPEFDITEDDMIGGTVSKQLCSLLSSEGTLDASSTEAADSSKSSEYEVSDDIIVQFGRDPSSPQTQKAASRTLFALDDNDRPHFDNDNDAVTEFPYPDIIIDSTSNTYDTPNHSVVTSSPNSFDRVSSEGNVSPIHLPKHEQLRQQRRSITLLYSPPNGNHSELCIYEDDMLNSTCHNIDKSNNSRKQLRSRRSLRSELISKSIERVAPKQYRNRNNGVNNTDCPRSGSANYFDDEECSSDAVYADECCSTDSDDDDHMETSRRLKHQQRLSSSSSISRRKSSINNPSTKHQNNWKGFSQRLSSTENLVWMLCFIGLTSVTMIVTMHHQMTRVADMDRRDHFSVLFRHPMTYQTKLKGFTMPPPKIAKLLPPKLTAAKSEQTKQIRGTITNTETLNSSESSSRRTVNLNTIAQFPHENGLSKVTSSHEVEHTSSNDHPSKSHHHDHDHHHHHHHDDTSKHHHTAHNSISNQRHHSFPELKSHDKMKAEVIDHAIEESKHHSHEEHHHHSHSEPTSERIYVKAYPHPIGMDSIPKVLTPETWDDDEVQRSFNLISPMMYSEHSETNEGTMLPRVVFIDGDEYFPPSKDRMVRRYRSEITDSTQLYSILDSGDERIASMELRAPYVQGECVPMKEWQTTFNPSCNGMHELDLSSMGDNRMEDDFKLFGMNGFWRNAWRYDSTGGHSSLTERDTVVLKTLRINHRFEDAYFENNRIDAVVLERLTASPHVINVFGFCGHSVLTEFADGKRLGELADKMAKVPLARLQIARDIANGLADVHGIDGDGNATFVHLDINPANVVSIGGTLKLNDFNIGVLRRWNTTSNTPCGIPAKYPNPQWRSPEEARLEQNLTEKVDVFSLGHIFFRLICGHEPWHKLEPGGMPSKEVLNEKVRQGILPTIPEDIMTSIDPEIVAIRDAMLRCYTYDPTHRPSAREIANFLQDSLNVLETNAN